MTETDYIKLPEVIEFVKWIIPKIKSYKLTIKFKKEVNPFEFKNLEEAAKGYKWPFSYIESSTGKKVNGTTYQDSLRVFAKFRKNLCEGLKMSNDKLCCNTCRDILAWGGVLYKGKNRERADNITAEYLSEVKSFFSNKNISLDGELKFLDSGKELIMNAGFTKIYAMLMDEFIIYDGRVGGALGKLVKEFLYLTKSPDIPQSLHFAWGMSQGINRERRNSSDKKYVFKQLKSGKWHTHNNLRANWLLKTIIKKSKTKIDIWQLQSALFMIGYDVKQSKDNLIKRDLCIN